MPTAKKSTRKSTRQSASTAVSTPPVTPTLDSPVMANPTAKPIFSPRLLRYTLVIVLIALLTYKLGPWLFPARVGYRPISRFEIWNNLEEAYGAQTLDDLVNEKVLDAALKEKNVQVDQAKIDEQIKSLETQFESVGGLDEALKQRGLTREDLNKQIVTQLSVEEILKDQIVPSDVEIQAEYEANQETLYADSELAEVKDMIASSLKETKLRDAFLAWFAEVKKEIPVTNFGL